MQALIATVDGLNMMVRYDQINGPITGHLVHIDNSIASFAIFVAMLPAEPMESEDDGLASLIADIEATAHSIAEFRLAPEVAELAKRHMAVLLLLLRTADAMGTDAALAAYAELIVRLRREKPQASEMGSPKQDFWDRITSWADRLTKWSDATEKGISLLGHASKAPELLSHIAL